MAINEQSPSKSKKQLAKELGVSRQSLYYKPKLPEKDLRIKAEIEGVMKKHKRYGHKRIAIELGINKKRARRVMKLFGLKPSRTRRSPFKKQDQNQAPMAIPNLIRGIIIQAPYLVWVSDFTYLPFFEMFVYLATVEDIFTRQIVGWQISTKHNSELVVDALLNALSKHPSPKISHSDQGSEYRSLKYQGTLMIYGIKPSMSEKASPWQNSHQESFYSEFKLELGHPESYLTFGNSLRQ